MCFTLFQLNSRGFCVFLLWEQGLPFPPPQRRNCFEIYKHWSDCHARALGSRSCGTLYSPRFAPHAVRWLSPQFPIYLSSSRFLLFLLFVCIRLPFLVLTVSSSIETIDGRDSSILLVWLMCSMYCVDLRSCFVFRRYIQCVLRCVALRCVALRCVALRWIWTLFYCVNHWCFFRNDHSRGHVCACISNYSKLLTARTMRECRTTRATYERNHFFWSK